MLHHMSNILSHCLITDWNLHQDLVVEKQSNCNLKSFKQLTNPTFRGWPWAFLQNISCTPIFPKYLRFHTKLSLVILQMFIITHLIFFRQDYVCLHLHSRHLVHLLEYLRDKHVHVLTTIFNSTWTCHIIEQIIYRLSTSSRTVF